MGIDFDELEHRLMTEFLDGASPTEWLVAAVTMNHDGASGLIAWMSEHDRLDRATASALYWYSQPAYHQRFAAEAEVPSVNRAGWVNVRRLQQRVASGDVVEAEVAFDPSNDLSTPTGNPRHPGEDWTADALSAADGPAWLIPGEMFEAVGGELLDVRAYCEAEGWEEGMPPSVLQVLEDAWEQSADDDED